MGLTKTERENMLHAAGFRTGGVMTRLESAHRIIRSLEQRGCYPSLYKRGNYWRAHVNQCGNFWFDHARPDTAFRRAIASWEDAGCPMDGRAAEPPEGR